MKKLITLTYIVFAFGLLQQGCSDGDTNTKNPNEPAQTIIPCQTPGFVQCNGICIDPMTSLQYCGANEYCEGYSVCNEEQSCQNGQCIDNTSTDLISQRCIALGYTMCDGKCIDPMHSTQYCGANKNCEEYEECDEEQSCLNGQCVGNSKLPQSCPIPGYVTCDDSCIDPMTSIHFCGANQNCEGYEDCGDEQFCLNGQCVDNPPQTCNEQGYVMCSGTCIDPMNSKQYCGANWDCTKYSACNIKETCQNGVCKPMPCPNNYHQFQDDCEPDSIAHCGQHNFACGDKIDGWTDGQCENAVCKATECAIGYHLYQDGCEPDSIAHCGQHNFACDDKIDGWTDGQCENAVCKAAECAIGYHLYQGGCESDTADHCGEHNYRCTENHPGFLDGKCIGTTCIATNCMQGYHLFQNSCEVDDDQNCGKHDQKCADLIEGYQSGECLETECHVLSCTDGYHLDAAHNTCVADTNECCGTTCGRCNSPLVCSKGSCEAQCETPLSKCNNECHNYAIDINHCGGCNQLCDPNKIDNSTHVTCSDSTCKATTCNSGYHVYEGICEPDSIYNCGVHDNNCSTTITGWETGTCKSGNCSATKCKENFHITTTGICEPDTNSCCGSSCISCKSWQTCKNGSCSNDCPETMVKCGSTCIDPNTDMNYCGADIACSNYTTCIAPESCMNGKCSYCLSFIDEAIKEYAISHWDIDHNNCISPEEASMVTEIPANAFKNNIQVESLDDLNQFPNLTTIREEAFTNCVNLKKARLDNISALEDKVFLNCVNLQEVVLKSINGDTLGMDTFKNVSCYVTLPSILYLDMDYKSDHQHLMPEQICNASITNLELSGSLRNISLNPHSFESCTSLNKLKLTNTKFTTYQQNFQYSSYIGSLYNSIIQQNSFYSTNATLVLNSLEFPDGLALCKSGISKIEILAEKPNIYMFSGTFGTNSRCPSCFAFVSYNTTSISNSSHLDEVDCSSIVSLSLPNATELAITPLTSTPRHFNWDVPSIAPQSLNQIYIPKLTVIPDGFLANSNITQLDGPNVKIVGTEVCSNCKLLNEINLPKAEKIGYSIYEPEKECSKATFGATIPGDSSFEYSPQFKTVNFPNAIEVCGFNNCNSLTSVTLPKAKKVKGFNLTKPYNYDANVAYFDLLTSVNIDMNIVEELDGFDNRNKFTYSLNAPKLKVKNIKSGIGTCPVYLPNLERNNGTITTCCSKMNYSQPKCDSKTTVSSLSLPKISFIDCNSFGSGTYNLELTTTEPIEYRKYCDIFDNTSRVTLTLNKNKQYGGSSSPLVSSDGTTWLGNTFKEIKFVE